MKTRTRAFRLPKELDKKVVEKAEKMGFISPSEYIRELVRNELMKEE